VGILHDSFVHTVRCSITSDLRYAVTQGAGQDYYDGWNLAVHDLARRKQVCFLESHTKRPWTFDYRLKGGEPWLVADGLVWDSESGTAKVLTHLIDLDTGAVTEGADAPAGFERSGWAEPRLVSDDGIRCEIIEEGRCLCVILPGEGRKRLLFTPDEKIVCVAIAPNGSCIAIACASGQMHFLGILS